MTDAKLNELIDEHGRRVLFAGHSMSKDKTLTYNLNKSKQAIVDYVAEQKNQAFNEGAAWEAERERERTG